MGSVSTKARHKSHTFFIFYLYLLFIYNRKMALHEVSMLIFVQYRIPRCQSSIPQYRKFFPSLPQYRTKLTPDTAILQTPKYPSVMAGKFQLKFRFGFVTYVHDNYNLWSFSCWFRYDKGANWTTKDTPFDARWFETRISSVCFSHRLLNLHQT